MKQFFLSFFLIFALMLQAQDFKDSYPNTKKMDQVDEFFGVKVEDPYRWLEDDLSDETKEWVEAENKVTFKYLEQIPFRAQLKEELTKIYNYEKVSAPFKEGKYKYFYKNDGLQQHSVLYRENNKGKVEVFLDPNTFSKDGSISLGGVSFSKDGSLCAYTISEGGSDWRKAIVIDAKNLKPIGDTLMDLKFTGIAWQGNDGFYYSSYDKPKEASALSGKTAQHKLFYHKLGTPQKKDPLIFGGEETPRRYISGYLTEDEAFLVITASISTTGNELYYKDLKHNGPITPILNHFDSNTYILYHLNNSFYIFTNLDAPNNRLVKMDLKNPSPENWKDIIPERKEVLNVSTANGYLFATYMKDAIEMVSQFDYDGKLIREVELPGPGSVGGFSSKKEDKDIYYSFTNAIYPSTIFKFDAKNGKSELYKKSKIDFKPEDYVSKQVFYNSHDGTQVPMTITHKKGLALDGSNPTILYGYGGFNISLTPSFSSVRAVWLQNGGILAVANLRGGGEYGQAWHKAGTQMNKKNVFHDFMAAAEYLKEHQYTSTEKLALQGGSNGGLLVGAVSTMKPDIAAVALPAVGVLDMLRYHTFTAGAGWAYDYGTAEDSKEMFEYLRSYSPVHNVKKGICYPATMITTGDHDDRVVPAHSFKYAAELQAKQGCQKPVLIRIETKAGHGAGKSTDVILNEYADIFAFAFYNMGIKSL